MCVLLLLPVLLALRLAAAPADTPVLLDGFDDGAARNGSDPLDTDWLRNRSITNLQLAVEQDLGLGAGPALACRFRETWGKIAAPLGAPFGLHGAGTYIRLEFTFRLLDDEVFRKMGDAPNKGSGAYFRFGLYQADGAIQREHWYNQDGDADGFGGFLAFANAATSNQVVGCGVFYEEGSDRLKHDVLGGPIPESMQNLAYAKNWNGIPDTRPHKVLFELRQSGPDTVAVSLVVDGETRVAIQKASLSGRPRTFDTLCFGLGAERGQFALDDVSVRVVPD